MFKKKPVGVQLSLPIEPQLLPPTPVAKQKYRTSSRCAMVIREWQILLELEGRTWKTLHELAGKTGVSQRTIRRDLAVLEEAGFPLVDDVFDESGRRGWRVADWRKEVA